MVEIWKPTGVDGYEVSNLGRVRSLDRVITLCDGRPKTIAGRILRPRRQTTGYLRVQLGEKNCRLIHRLVLKAFCGEPGPGQETRHINSDRADNRLVNLAWGTREENILDKWARGTAATKAKLCDADVQTIRLWLAMGYGGSSIARAYNVGPSIISAIKHGQCWKHTYN